LIHALSPFKISLPPGSSEQFPPKKAGMSPLSRIYFSCKRRDRLEEALHNIAKGVTGLRTHDERQRVDGTVAWRDFCFAVLLKAWRGSCSGKKILDSIGDSPA